MANNVIELKSIGELLGKNFFIPSYQRGYRWTGQQVKDLLDDINEFRANSNGDGFYCLQPLVIKKSIVDAENFIASFQGLKQDALLEGAYEIINKYTRWDVIDGQQRLTTLCILLNYLSNKNPYHVEYETRKNSAEYLKKITAEVKENADNVDYYHMHLVYEEIKRWFENENEEFKEKFKDTILNRVKFIWYESVDEDAIEVFTRLNIGKIKLTNAELIKALMLNRSNFAKYDSLTLRQQEIASQWDQIEYTLQDDAFWLFLHSEKYKPVTRIDFIFDLICEQNILTVEHKKNNSKVYNPTNKIKIIGTDEYQTFRYFYEYFHKAGDKTLTTRLEECWKEVNKYFNMLKEWYDDYKLYHYIGYLISFENNSKVIIKNLTKEWFKHTRAHFKEVVLCEKIKKKVEAVKNLNQIYCCKNYSKAPDKTTCKPILLLHNIQTIINQNDKLESCDKYGLSVFYKFPFHLYKIEKWDVEHIDSNTSNDLDKFKDQQTWLRDVIQNEIGLTDKLKYMIVEFLNANKEDAVKFEELRGSVYVELERDQDSLNDEEKNQIWNFCLLNASTNRSYGNAIFPVKRMTIIKKDKGEEYSEDASDKKKNNAIAFIPPVTKNIFLKYYTNCDVQFRTWNRKDAEGYKENIHNMLQGFGIELR